MRADAPAAGPGLRVLVCVAGMALFPALPGSAEDFTIEPAAVVEVAEVRIEAGRKAVYVGGVKAEVLLHDLSAGLKEIEERIGEVESGQASDRSELLDLRAARQSLTDERKRLKDFIEQALSEEHHEAADQPEPRGGGASPSGEGLTEGGGPGAGSGAGGGSGPGRAAGARSLARGKVSPGSAAHGAAAKALKIADTLRSALGGPAGMGQSAASGAGSGRGDMMLAFQQGYRGVYEKLGLGVGAGPDGRLSVLRKDGSPASAQEVGMLRTALAAEPRALVKRPDFFDVLGRQDFQRLKSAYGSQPRSRQTVFRDMEVPAAGRSGSPEAAGNDFVWSRSCAMVSGECNQSAGGLSYRKGDFVPPEDLKAAAKELDEMEGEEARASSPSAADDSKQDEEEFQELIELLESESLAQESESPGWSPGIAGRLAKARGRLSGGILADAMAWLGMGEEDAGVRSDSGGGGTSAAPGRKGRSFSGGVAAPARGAAGASRPAGSAKRRFPLWLPFVCVGLALVYIGIRGRRS
ncbi:MAG: hypothetical protein HY927_06820 [Elusimicrobia bacterium]|nr:hypothetical protein [Elusimicrobiota bacterium]